MVIVLFARCLFGHLIMVPILAWNGKAGLTSVTALRAPLFEEGRERDLLALIE